MSQASHITPPATAQPQARVGKAKLPQPLGLRAATASGASSLMASVQRVAQARMGEGKTWHSFRQHKRWNVRGILLHKVYST